MYENCKTKSIQMYNETVKQCVPKMKKYNQSRANMITNIEPWKKENIIHIKPITWKKKKILIAQIIHYILMIKKKNNFKSTFWLTLNLHFQSKFKNVTKKKKLEKTPNLP